MSERLQLLADASRMLAESSLDYSATLEALAKIVVPRLADDFVAFLLDGQVVHRVAEASVSSEHEAILRSLRENPPALGASNTVFTAIRSGETVFVEHVDEHVIANLAGSTQHATALRAVNPHTFISVPLFGRGHVIGAFTFGMSVSARTYSREDIVFAEELGRRAGMALENALLLRDALEARSRAERAEQRMTRLQATSAALGHVMTSAEAGNVLLAQAVELFAATAGAVYALRGDLLHLLAKLHRDPPRTIAMTAKLPIVHAARTGTPLFLHDRDEIVARFPDVIHVLPETLHAAMALPLAVEGRAIGAAVINFDGARTFTADERQFADALASQAALAIDRALLVERDRERANRAAFLAEAAEVMASSLDCDRVLGDLMRLVVPRYADWCAVELVEGESTRQVAVGHVDPAKIQWAHQLREKYPPDRSQETGVFQVIRTAKPELHPRIPHEMIERRAVDAEHLALLRRLDMRSALIVPLIASGKPIGAITAVWAESHHEYTETDLELFMELAHRAALAVVNAQLYRELQQAVQVRDDFLAAAGHELKTPLAALLMHVDSMHRQLRKNILPTNLFQRLDKASRAGTRLEKLIDELLDVSRITAGRLQLDPEPFSLDELVREVVERFAEQATSPITLHVEPVSGTWDRARIDQVVSNLVANALKYGRGKPVDVELGPSDGRAVLRVVDRGIGIAEAEQSKIFERFERAVENREFGGFGLGLWIARQIVETSGGTIEVDSTPGEGATFTVKLPR